MKKSTIQFIEALFEGYADSSSGQEEDNAKELKEAWADLEAYKANDAKEKRIVEQIYAEFMKPEITGLFDLGARVCEILVENKYKQDEKPN